MSNRSQRSFIIRSLLVFSLLFTFILSFTNASGQADSPTPTSVASIESKPAGSSLQYRAFFPVIASENASIAQRRPTQTPILPTATQTALKTNTPPPVQPTATRTALKTNTPPPAQPTATQTAPVSTATSVPPTPTTIVPSSTPTSVPPTATPNPTSTPTTIPAAGIYYVSVSGSDNNPGTLSLPWRTIQKAANTMVAGETVQIRAGTYNERVMISRSGNASAGYITYSNYPGETPVIDGTGIAIVPTAGLVHMANVSYIKITGLRVTNSDDAGIFATRSSYIIVQNNSTQNTHSSGVGIWRSDNIVVDGNIVVDARYVELAQGGHEESITISSTTNFEVMNNDVSLQNNPGYLGNEGIDVKESSRNGKVHHNYIHDFPTEGGAIYVDAWTAGLNGTPSLSDIEIYNNIVEDAGSIVIGAERGGTAENIKIYNNLVVNCPDTGIGISNTGIANAPNGNGLRRNIEIYNNTIYKTRWNGGAGIFIKSANIINIVIRNNITYINKSNGQIVVAVPSALSQITADHNLVFGSKYCPLNFLDCVEVSNVTNSTIFGNITADPKFADVISKNFRLALGSPGIDSGLDLVASGVLADFDGIARPQGGSFDLGVYEYR